MEKIENALYIVATPIGNLEELTPRAQYILSNVDLIACEDTRVTIKLLSHFNISKPLVSCHKFNEQNASEKLIEEIKEGKTLSRPKIYSYTVSGRPQHKHALHCSSCTYEHRRQLQHTYQQPALTRCLQNATQQTPQRTFR